jgi:membrane protein DedA with SNARE-associated domain
VAGDAEAEHRRRIPIALLVAPIVAATVMNMVGDAIGPRLITTNPALQIFLSPKNRYYLLAAPQLDAITFFSIGFVRLLLTDPMFFLLGYYHGDAALRWAEEKLGDNGPMIRTAERWFRKAAPLVILIAPTSYLNLLAGATGMKVRVYVILNLVGTAGRLALFWFAGEAFEDELESVLEFVRRYQWWLVGASVVIVSLQAARQAGKGMLDKPSDIAEEIEDIEDDLVELDEGPGELRP